MEIGIYVKSAGFSEHQDYCWQKIGKNSQTRTDEPQLVKKFKDLIETEAPSIFIGRDSNQLILLVTGMKASKRKDYRDRIIRNSIALIAQDNQDNEQKIRGVAVLALEGKLENEIDIAIKEEGEYGFEVSYEKIENTIKASLQTNNSTGTKPVMIGKNSEDNRKIIAGELQQSCLPQKTNASASEALVVVTGIKTEDALKEAGVWRGLSNLVKKEKFSPYEPLNSAKKFFEGNKETWITWAISLGAIGTILWFLWSSIGFHIGQAIQPNVLAAAISPGGQYFATADPYGKLLVQNTQNKTNSTIENNDPVKSVAISSDGNYVVTGDETGNVQLWNVTNKKRIEINNSATLKHDKAVLSVAINSNASNNQIIIVSGGADGEVILWTVAKHDKGETTTSNQKLFP